MEKRMVYQVHREVKVARALKTPYLGISLGQDCSH